MLSCLAIIQRISRHTSETCVPQDTSWRRSALPCLLHESGHDLVHRLLSKDVIAGDSIGSNTTENRVYKGNDVILLILVVVLGRLRTVLKSSCSSPGYISPNG